jgi:hypothetical protein
MLVENKNGTAYGRTLNNDFLEMLIIAFTSSSPVQQEKAG